MKISQEIRDMAAADGADVVTLAVPAPHGS
jgi:hypothetical protein